MAQCITKCPSTLYPQLSLEGNYGVRIHLTTAVALLASNAAATIYYVGVAESNGEFSWVPTWREGTTSTPGTGLPGKFGVDYTFINKCAIGVFVDQNKVNLFRVDFLLERMCPIATGLGAKFDEEPFFHFKDAIDYITINKSVYAILDPHNYMRYNNPSQQPMTGSIIGNSSDPKAATTAQFGAFWGELSRRFKGNEKVIFGLMNEPMITQPHDMATSLVLVNDQTAIDAIRKHSWTQGSYASSLLLQNIKDPLNNTAFDIHEYVDSDYSGGHVNCTNLASVQLAPLTAMITEFGTSNSTGCTSYMADIIKQTHNTAWAAGLLWGTSSPCCTDQAHWGSLEPGSTAADGTPGLYETV
ncbi:glycoside hydrolase [Acephala macrosclerotiorum]|nr:glycoside hydrolase [Acephala macrosclerotiorum]